MMGMGIPQGFGGSLGSGMVFTDDITRSRDIYNNASRVEGWKLSKSYDYWMSVGSVRGVS